MEAAPGFEPGSTRFAGGLPAIRNSRPQVQSLRLELSSSELQSDALTTKAKIAYIINEHRRFVYIHSYMC